ncbi:iron-containing alcohol dehydrogenase PsrA [Roseovarius pelagicus]|uniref:Phosphonoacetaldehyde reductase n=1 Tax=Roseovarius pelagicus TaxID=2980108 RepID=A0ABY6DFG1_9RHOB|nr:iron-containing alcohol dehydrogenase PsrA [Roseovarius pelagicus]UXX84907.1 phosphonoacetaldehyde reductase [Roseovarius pelagicus]
MWTYSNPVNVIFGTGAYSKLADLIGGRRYALVTYPEPPFAELAQRIESVAGKPVLTIDDVAPNPDYTLLEEQSGRFADLAEPIDVIVAVGGGSVIDSTKVFAAAGGNFGNVARFLETKAGEDALSFLPIIAVPTTAGTGSEVTCWATVWNEDKGKKYSLAHPELYPETALVDPELMLGKPLGLTLATGLDALSHSLESIWNVNANPVSARHAVAASRLIMDALPQLVRDPGNLDLRTDMAEASLCAGLAFSNTKTAIAHNLSYPITLGWGVQHGIACSFTLPTVLRSVIGIGGFREAALNEIFGTDLNAGADRLTQFLSDLGIGARFADHGIPADKCADIIDEAFAGERGKNFVGTKDNFIAAAQQQNVIRLSAA